MKLKRYRIVALDVNYFKIQETTDGKRWENTNDPWGVGTYCGNKGSCESVIDYLLDMQDIAQRRLEEKENFIQNNPPVEYP